MKQLVLLGGGHSHIEVLRRLGYGRPPATRITLVNPGPHAIYSGMLPGLIAGHYAADDCRIDLARLCRFAGAECVIASATALDPAQRRVKLSDGKTLAYDVLSFDTGSAPDVRTIPGAAEYTIGVRPLAQFLKSWDAICAAVTASRQGPAIAVVGGGAGGVELALAMRHRLTAAVRGGSRVADIHLVTDSATILPHHPRRVRRILTTLLHRHGIALHAGSRVTKVTRSAIHRESGAPLRATFIILAISAGAPSWIADSGVATDRDGFIAVNDALQSVSHPDVFAAGDVASPLNHTTPKSGVYAVRQGPPLAGNLLAALASRPLTAHLPQRRALALISTGDRHAVASWGPLTFSGDWVWRWKDRIDRRFVAKYREAV
ncbi:MAG TPA: FAD-dependent oxidoreductase [Burkholderiales bacterium]|nr:FAD-dependent oxidoreductase [Burkholderiales bacterium]